MSSPRHPERALADCSYRRRRPPLGVLGVVAVSFCALSCKTTLDSIGCGEPNRGLDGGSSSDAGVALAPLVGPATYPNLFRELLGKSESETLAKINGVFNQLFHGDPSNEAIFVPTGTDQAYLYDVLHSEIRSEGLGVGMLITVQLDKREDFDKLWRYAKATQIQSGPAQGYFPSYCYVANSNSDQVCNDPFGMQTITTALLLARGRWKNWPGSIDYGQEAANLLDIIRYKEAYNCGIPGPVTSVFDTDAKLPYDMPIPASANISRPSIVMPAFYDLWARATGDAFWSEAAAAARRYWQVSAHPITGLIPMQATFDGTPVPGLDYFGSECDRTFINMALDRVWSGTKGWLTDESNRVLQFFTGQGLSGYGQSFSLDGTDELTPIHDISLVAANGVLALAATVNNRSDFVAEVWNIATPPGNGRYYAGFMQLLALLTLGGQMRVY
jgi:oligosaccharide reducing-end xylanase